MKFKLLSIFFSVLFLMTEAQTKLLVSGPMLGYIEHREALVWLEVDKSVKTAAIKYWETENPKIIATINYKGELGKEFNPIKFILENLKMNVEYKYELLLNGNPVQTAFPLSFKTKELWEWRKDAPDFSFLFGSCSYINDSIYDRPGKPYGGPLKIFETMGNTPADFNLWDGDNVYLREADYSSVSGIRYRFHHSRKPVELQKVLASRPNFALWDDHDFGPNDSNGSFEFKEETRQTFINYWGNRTYGEDGKGIYSKVRWSDIEFFLLDDRYFRSDEHIADSINGQPNPSKQMFGKTQLDWLKNNLLVSRSPFKIIVNGGQVLNPNSTAESLKPYKTEYHDLLNFIKTNKIEGVVFLSGDRHLTELIKVELPDFYPLYDYTGSPFTAGPYKLTEKNPEFKNPARVEGSLFTENNFSKISVSGKRNERVMTIQTFDINGEKKWEYQIKAQDLKVKKETK